MWPIRKSCVWPVHFLHFKILPKPCVWDVMAISITRVSRVKRLRRFGAILGMEGTGKKILTLLTLYNGPAALFCGFLTAILMAILFCFGILPSIDRGYFGIPFSPWCLPSGFVVSIVVMISWRSPTKVFLDRICISQNDNDLKTQAIFSLACLLKNFRGHADFMGSYLDWNLDLFRYVGLKFWRSCVFCWTQKDMFRHLFCDIGNSKPKERLWCLFELAAFLKSKKMDIRKTSIDCETTFFWALFPLQFLRSLLLLRFLWQPFRLIISPLLWYKWWLPVWSVVWWWVIQQLLADLLKHKLIFVWIFFRLDGNPNQKYHSWSFSFSNPHLVNWNESCFAVFFHSKMARLASTGSDGS